MGRREELIEAVEEANKKGGMDRDQWYTLFIAQIAISLAVIADKLTGEGDDGQKASS